MPPTRPIEQRLPTTPARGTYILILRLPNDAEVTVGSMGSYRLPGGWYGYVGSALGSGGLRARLRHHLTPSDRPYWHIDYLRRATELHAIWLLESDLRREHAWSEIVAELPDATRPILRFGSSDCGCDGHLFHCAERPSPEEFRRRAESRFPDDDDMRTIEIIPETM